MSPWASVVYHIWLPLRVKDWMVYTTFTKNNDVTKERLICLLQGIDSLAAYPRIENCVCIVTSMLWLHFPSICHQPYTSNEVGGGCQQKSSTLVFLFSFMWCHKPVICYFNYRYYYVNWQLKNQTLACSCSLILNWQKVFRSSIIAVLIMLCDTATNFGRWIRKSF